MYFSWHWSYHGLIRDHRPDEKIEGDEDEQETVEKIKKQVSCKIDHYTMY